MKMTETVKDTNDANVSVKYKIIPVPYYYPVPVDRDWYYANKDSLAKQNEEFFGFPEPQLQHFRPSFHHKPPRFQEEFITPDKYQNGNRRPSPYQHVEHHSDDSSRRNRHDIYRNDEEKRRVSPYYHVESSNDDDLPMRKSSYRHVKSSNGDDLPMRKPPYHHIEYCDEDEFSQKLKENKEIHFPVVKSVGSLKYIQDEISKHKIKEESNLNEKSDDVDKSKHENDLKKSNDEDSDVSKQSNEDDVELTKKSKEEISIVSRKEEIDISSQRKRIRNVIGSLYDKKIKESSENGRIDKDEVNKVNKCEELDDLLTSADEDVKQKDEKKEKSSGIENGNYFKLGKEWEKPRVIYGDALRPVIPSNIPYVPVTTGPRESARYASERKPTYNHYYDYPNSLASVNDNSSPDDENKPRHHSSGRRSRTVFSRRQLVVLNNIFDRNPFVSGVKMSELSDYLGLDRKIVKIWFQNKRQYERKKGSSVDRENEMYRADRYNMKNETPTMSGNWNSEEH